MKKKTTVILNWKCAAAQLFDVLVRLKSLMGGIRRRRIGPCNYYNSLIKKRKLSAEVLVAERQSLHTYPSGGTCMSQTPSRQNSCIYCWFISSHLWNRKTMRMKVPFMSAMSAAPTRSRLSLIDFTEVLNMVARSTRKIIKLKTLSVSERTSQNRSIPNEVLHMVTRLE